LFQERTGNASRRSSRAAQSVGAYPATERGTLARSILSMALDEAEPDPPSIVALLDSMPGAFDRANQGLREIRAGEGIPLDEF
jgi:hypothetical protein